MACPERSRRVPRTSRLLPALLVVLGAGAAWADAPEDEYRSRRASLGAKDVDGRVALGDFCSRNKMREQAALLGAEAWVLSPRSKPALDLLARLDYRIAFDGKSPPVLWWVPGEKWREGHGFIRQGDAWITSNQAVARADLAKATEALKAIEKTIADEKAVKARETKVKYLEQQESDLEKHLDDSKNEIERTKQALNGADDRQKQAQKNYEQTRGLRLTNPQRQDAETELDAATTAQTSAKKACDRALERWKRLAADETPRKLDEARAALEELTTAVSAAKDAHEARKQNVEDAKARVAQTDEEANAVAARTDASAKRELERATEELLRRSNEK